MQIVNENAARVYTFIEKNDLDITADAGFMADQQTQAQHNQIKTKREQEIEEDRRNKNFNKIDEYLKKLLSFNSLDGPLNSSTMITIPPSLKTALDDLGYPGAKNFIKDSDGDFFIELEIPYEDQNGVPQQYRRWE